MKDLIQKLKDSGFNEEQIKEVMQIAEQEIVDIIFEDFALNAPEEKVHEYSQKITAAKDDPEKFSALFEEIMSIQYGSENVQQEKEKLLREFLQNVIDLTLQTKEVKQKYEQGDEETVNAVEEAKTDPSVKKITKEIDDEDQDKG